jgi:acetylglutamate kinase
MTRVVVKVGGRVAADSASAVVELAGANDVCVVHGAGPQISADMERAGIPVEFVGGRRVTTREALEVVRRSFAHVNGALCAAIGDRAVGLFGDEAGLQVDPVPELGLVGEARPAPLPELERLLDEGRIPVVAPVTRGLNVNADSAAAAIATGIGADQLLFLTDVDGLILGGEMVDRIDVAEAEELMASGTLEGGIIPKLGAAIAAARAGVPAYIGRTEVPI